MAFSGLNFRLKKCNDPLYEKKNVQRADIKSRKYSVVDIVKPVSNTEPIIIRTFSQNIQAAL